MRTLPIEEERRHIHRARTFSRLWENKSEKREQNSPVWKWSKKSYFLYFLDCFPVWLFHFNWGLRMQSFIISLFKRKWPESWMQKIIMDGLTAFTLVCFRGHQVVVQLLLEHFKKSLCIDTDSDFQRDAFGRHLRCWLFWKIRFQIKWIFSIKRCWKRGKKVLFFVKSKMR